MVTLASFDSVYRKALGLLKASPKSAKALEEKLLASGVEASIAESVIERLIQEGVVNDEETARRSIELLRRKYAGKGKILFELEKKGYEGSLIESLLDDWSMEQEEFLARDWINNHLKEELDGSVKSKRALAGKLAQKGFEEEIVESVIESFNWDDATEYDD